MPEGVLEGVKVLDVSEDIAGSFCARLLADYGAEVLKVEPPGGAALRRMGPFFHDEPDAEKSLFFLALNLNKKGVTLNLESSTGQAIFRRLAEYVDVVVESYRPGYLASLGLGFDDLRQTNPALVLTSITPFGQDGPYSQFKGEEIVSYAMSMVMGISGVQGREPLKHGGFQAQYQGGLFGAGATAMALFAQDCTGEGEHVDVSVTECAASTMMAAQTIYPFMGGIHTRRKAEGSLFENPTPCKDGWIIIQTGGTSWDEIANFFGDPQLLEPRFVDRAQRAQLGDELDRIMLTALQDQSKWDLFDRAAQARLLFGVVQTPSELAQCPQLESRDFYREVDHPVMGKVRVPAQLLRFSDMPFPNPTAAPTLGQNNQEIYVEGLGYTQQELCQLRQINVI